MRIVKVWPCDKKCRNATLPPRFRRSKFTDLMGTTSAAAKQHQILLAKCSSTWLPAAPLQGSAFVKCRNSRVASATGASSASLHSTPLLASGLLLTHHFEPGHTNLDEVFPRYPAPIRLLASCVSGNYLSTVTRCHQRTCPTKLLTSRLSVWSTGTVLDHHQ